MGQIHALPDLLVNQIAAGEVVERPASALKELVENSLDAGAQSVSVDLAEGGMRRIRVADDGAGIEAGDLPLALARFATSKIATLEDLERAATLGFRGEALASIGAVSRLAITSRRAGERHAWRVSCEGGALAPVEPAALAAGTTVEVEELYYNTPARRKFLRSEATEFARCEEAFSRAALSRPSVAFSLAHNGRRVAHLAPSPPRERVSAVVGDDFAAAAVEVRTTWRPPPSQKFRWIRFSRSRVNSRPTMNRSMTTPTSARTSMVRVFLTSENPPGPMRMPVRRKPTTGGSLILWETKMMRTEAARRTTISWRRLRLITD